MIATGSLAHLLDICLSPSQVTLQVAGNRLCSDDLIAQSGEPSIEVGELCGFGQGARAMIKLC